MNWYTEGIIKEASQSEDRLLSAFQQTWPQLLEIIKKYKNEFLPSIENKSEDEKNRAVFTDKVTYSWNGKDETVRVTIDNDPQKMAMASGNALGVNYYPKAKDWRYGFTPEKDPGTWVHELAHVFQHRNSSERGNFARAESKKGRVAYLHRAYEIHARWAEGVVMHLHGIDLAADKTRSEFNLIPEMEKNDLQKTIARLFMDQLRVRSGDSTTDGILAEDLLKAINKGAISQAASMLGSQAITRDTYVDPRKWRGNGMETARDYYGDSSSGWIAPDEKWTKRYLKKLNEKSNSVLSQKIFDTYNKLVSEYYNFKGTVATDVNTAINKRQEPKQEIEALQKEFNKCSNEIGRIFSDYALQQDVGLSLVYGHIQRGFKSLVWKITDKNSKKLMRYPEGHPKSLFNPNIIENVNEKYTENMSLDLRSALLYYYLEANLPSVLENIRFLSNSNTWPEWYKTKDGNLYLANEILSTLRNSNIKLSDKEEQCRRKYINTDTDKMLDIFPWYKVNFEKINKAIENVLGKEIYEALNHKSSLQISNEEILDYAAIEFKKWQADEIGKQTDEIRKQKKEKSPLRKIWNLFGK
jgi:hypothetical protein